MTNSPHTTKGDHVRETEGVFSASRRVLCQYTWFEAGKHAAGRSKLSEGAMETVIPTYE